MHPFCRLMSKRELLSYGACHAKSYVRAFADSEGPDQQSDQEPSLSANRITGYFIVQNV